MTLCSCEPVAILSKDNIIFASTPPLLLPPLWIALCVGGRVLLERVSNMPDVPLGTIILPYPL